MTERTDPFISAELQFRAQQEALKAKLKRLETEYGVSADNLIDVYGKGIATQPDIIDRWVKLLDTLKTTDKAMVCLLNPKTQLTPGCYGFGQAERYESAADFVIITNPHEAQISFEESAEGKYKMAVLRANGYRMLQSSYSANQFDTLTEAPKPMEISIATGFHGLTGFSSGDLHKKIVDGNNYWELHENIMDEFGPYEPAYNIFSNDTAYWRLFGAATCPGADEATPWLLEPARD